MPYLKMDGYLTGVTDGDIAQQDDRIADTLSGLLRVLAVAYVRRA